MCTPPYGCLSVLWQKLFNIFISNFLTSPREIMLWQNPCFRKFVLRIFFCPKHLHSNFIFYVWNWNFVLRWDSLRSTTSKFCIHLMNFSMFWIKNFLVQLILLKTSIFSIIDKSTVEPRLSRHTIIETFLYFETFMRIFASRNYRIRLSRQIYRDSISCIWTRSR